MSLDSVHPGIGSRAIRPGQDAHDDRRPDSRQQGKPKQSAKDHEPGTVLNDLGQVTGQTINVTA